MKKDNLAILMNDLQAPMVVSDILSGRDNLAQSDYALSSLISDMRMDQALIAISVSLHMIVEPYVTASPTLQVVHTQTQRITEDFSYDYIAGIEHNDMVAKRMEQISEDLDYVAELLELSINFFRAKDDLAFNLCRILKAQADSHHLVTEMFLCQIEAQPEEGDPVNSVENLYKEPIHKKASFFAQIGLSAHNVIPFSG